jgi:crotonobetainyl-CoA:carnitine CoA-transferase CaiB-like acyl-CoA transferase
MDEESDGHARRDEIHRLVAARLTEHPTAHWLEVFEEAGVWAGPVHSYADVAADPQVKFNESLITYQHHTEGEVTTPGFPIKFGRTPAEITRGAPVAGEHSHAILAELGLSAREIADLIDSGVVHTEHA